MARNVTEEHAKALTWGVSSIPISAADAAFDREISRAIRDAVTKHDSATAQTMKRIFGDKVDIAQPNEDCVTLSITINPDADQHLVGMGAYTFESPMSNNTYQVRLEPQPNPAAAKALSVAVHPSGEPGAYTWSLDAHPEYDMLVHIGRGYVAPECALSLYRALDD